jgi:hypothetical protein
MDRDAGTTCINGGWFRGEVGRMVKFSVDDGVYKEAIECKQEHCAK